MMKDSKIQTLHPEKGKQNQKIPLEKYEIIRLAILDVLAKSQLTHTELVEKLKKKLKGKFEGNVLWYGITVKLDLEAKGIITRSNSKTPSYYIV
jgi:hypothetical protein